MLDFLNLCLIFATNLCENKAAKNIAVNEKVKVKVMVPTPVCFLVVRLTIANHFSDSGMMLYIPFHFLKTQCHPCPDGMKRSLQLRVKM